MTHASAVALPLFAANGTHPLYRSSATPSPQCSMSIQKLDQEQRTTTSSILVSSIPPHPHLALHPTLHGEPFAPIRRGPLFKLHSSFLYQPSQIWTEKTKANTTTNAGVESTQAIWSCRPTSSYHYLPPSALTAGCMYVNTWTRSGSSSLSGVKCSEIS